MVELHDSTMPEFKADAMMIANAFRAASDDDTRNVMNFMSDRTQNELESMKFYVVSSSWFMTAWPILTARTPDGLQEGWREQVGRIQNADLMNVEREVSSSEDEDEANMSPARRKKRFEQLHRRIARNRERSSMKQGLVHERDFFFLGPSAWMLVKEKFGFDGYEIARPVVPKEGGLLAIELQSEESEDNKSALIEIPASGRFAYEKIIPAAESSKSAVVPEDEGNNVSWDDAANPTNGRVKTSPDEPVLLLPPSTTAATTGGSDDMDVESRTSDKGSIMSPGVTAALSGRKRLASGLGNLGNTCFMNSTLQCLAHTEPLRRYFLSGEYESDLNRDNPLGTGGELASQFANLISEMWGVPAKRRNVMGTNESHYTNSSSSAVYPRSFKYCVGKHAEQFMGYDQHDSQEFATYLLDALHEDTNRVTKKPYIEKPEQGEDEPDDIAAAKAWDLHLQREDSKVLENFMGQVKSRLECCTETCNRVSTTFDPFMYLSVPIPGATDRTMKVTFVPLDPAKRMRNISLTLNKAASMTKLMKKMNEELVSQGVCEEPIPLEDLCPVDVWSHEVFSWYKHDSEIDRIRDSDHTYIYQLRSLKEIREATENESDSSNGSANFGETRTKHKLKLDLETMTKLNKDDEWTTVLEKYVQHPTLLFALFNPNRGTVEERMQFHRKLEHFIDLCHNEIAEGETTGLKRGREERESGAKSDMMVTPTEEPIQGLLDRCDTSKTFTNVKTRHDVAILEFCANKLRQYILKLINDKRQKYKDGFLVQIVMRRPQNGSNTTQDFTFAAPIVMRLPSNMTVYDLRKELAARLSRSLQAENRDKAETVENGIDNNHDISFGSSALRVMLQVPLTYDRKASYGTKSNIAGNKKLGMLEKEGCVPENGGRMAVYAIETDEAEQALVSDVVGPNGSVNVDWPYDLCEREFDLVEYETTDEAKNDQDKLTASEKRKTTTVLDCIEKYCQMEQLEETEMWYCNRCKDHVRAWKQFHLYRVPPILIVHLKRFQYSASTHRRDKITSFIDFPLEGLDLRDMVSHYNDDEKPIYDLYAVSNHYGGLGGGHYTAYILNDDGTWCHYDDSRVTSNIDPTLVVTEAAYVLYYRRRDLPVIQDYVEDTEVAPMVYDQPENVRDSSEVSSNNTAQAGDDDMAIDDADGSSRTCSSPMGSIDGEHHPEGSGDLVAFLSDPGAEDDFPLQ